MGEKEKASMASSAKKSGTGQWYKRREEIGRALREYKYNRDIYHVISREGDRWGVLREGNKRMHKIYDDKKSAIEYAKQLVRAQKKSDGEVVVHRKDGYPEECFHAY